MTARPWIGLMAMFSTPSALADEVPIAGTIVPGTPPACLMSAGPDQIDATAIAVVEHHFRLAIAVGIKQRADVAERIPLR